MNNTSMKNMIVLKNLPSNLIDEAIVIFKPNVNLNKYKSQENENKNIKVQTIKKEFVIKEAEDVINSYISNLEKPKQLERINKELVAKCKRIKILSAIFGVVAILGIIVNII